MKVEIRPLEIEDAYTSVKWRNDPEVFKYTGNTYNHEITIESELNWIKMALLNPKDYRCAIIVDGKYVGNIYLTDIENGIGNYHIFIGDKSYWGKGVAKKASQLIISYAFNKLKLTEIRLKVNVANLQAICLYRKLGFQEVMKVGDKYEMSLQSSVIPIN